MAEQQVIVTKWQQAQREVTMANERATCIQAEVETNLLSELGLIRAAAAQHARAFVFGWSAVDRWGVAFLRQTPARTTPEAGRFPVVRMGEIVADLENGWSPQCLNHPVLDDEDWGVLKLGAVSFGNYDDTENKALPPGLKPVPDLEIRPGQVLISRANIPRLVGACALVERTRPRLLLCDKIFRVIFKPNSTIEPAYLAEVLKSAPLRSQIEAAATGTSPTMQNITKPALLALRLPLPPLESQRVIVARIAEARVAIARERETARRLAEAAKLEIETRLLGRSASTATPA